MPLIYNYQQNQNAISPDNLAKKRIVKAFQQQTSSYLPRTDPNLDTNADKLFDKIFELSNSIETYLFELGVFVTSEDTSKVDVLGETQDKTRKAAEIFKAKINAELSRKQNELKKIEREIEKEEAKKNPNDQKRANLEEKYFGIQEEILQLSERLDRNLVVKEKETTMPLSLEEEFEEEEEKSPELEEPPELEGNARKFIKGKKLIFKEEQSIPIVAKLLNLFNTYKKAWKEIVPVATGLDADQLTDLGVMVDSVSKSLNSFIEDTRVEIPRNKQRVYEQLFVAVDKIQSILLEVEQIYQNIYFYHSQTSSPPPPSTPPQSVGVTTGAGFAVRQHYSRTRYL